MKRLFPKDGWPRIMDNTLVVSVVFTFVFAAIRGVGTPGPPGYKPLIPVGFLIDDGPSFHPLNERRTSPNVTPE